MSDTIELLNAIGQNATLRHASADELAPILEQAKASEALKSAVAAGDSSLLFEELGQKPNHAPQITNAPGHEEEDEEEEKPDHDGDGKSRHPSEPGHRTPHKQ